MGFQPFPVFGRGLRRGFGRIGNTNPNAGYLLYDRFSIALAAGSVNGSRADTGQVRTVTDTNLKLSVSNNVLSFVTGGVGAGDPALWYPSMNTVVGTPLFGSLDPTGSVPNIGIGFDTSASGSIQDCIRLIGGSLVNVIFAGSNVSLGSYSVSSIYQLCVLQGLLGFYFLIKGGSEFIKWTLLWKSLTGAPSARLPAVGVQSSTTGIGNVDNMRIPLSTYIPISFAYDTFTRADGSLGATEVIGPDGQTISSRVWSSSIGTWGITSNKAGASTLSGGLAIATIPVPSKDNTIEVNLTRSAGIVGVIGRYIDANNYIYAYHDGVNAGVKQRLVGVETDLIAATAATFVANAPIKLIMDTNSCFLFYNNVRLGGTGVINAALNGAIDGLYTTDTGNTFDVATVLPRGTSDEFSGLDAFAA